MRTCRRKNSRPQANVEFRELYRSRNPTCEIGDWLVIAGELEKYTLRDVEVHHISIGGRKGKCDVLSNLISVSREAHEFCHRFPKDGKTICLYVKMRKGELFVEEVRQAFGMSAGAVVDRNEPTRKWLQPAWEELRRHIQEYESKLQ